MGFSLSQFVPVWLVEAGGLVILAAVLIGLTFKILRWRRVTNPLMSSGSRRTGYLYALTSALKISITQRDVITDSLLRLVMHQLIFWGFILCGVATTLVWVTGTAEKARTFADVPKIIGNIGGVMLLIGTIYLLARLILSRNFRQNRTIGDLTFFLTLFIVTVTGFTTQYFRIGGDPNLALANYYIHLAANIVLLGAAPFTHFIHAITTPLMRLIIILHSDDLYKLKLYKIAEEVKGRFFETGEDKK